MPDPVSLIEYEALARQTLGGPAFDYFASGAGAEITVRENQEAFNAIRLRPRVLVRVGQRDQLVTLFGRQLPSPIFVAPMAFQKMAHPDGELATVRACAAAGAVFVASTVATVGLEEIAAATPAPKWFQLYVFKDRGVTRTLVERAEAAGYEAMQVTADLPVMGRREADVRNCFSLPEGLAVTNLESAGHGCLASDGTESGPALYSRYLFDPDLSWRDIEWLRSMTRLPVLVKGILRGDDADRAISHGASGVVVSNHGGRQLDTVVPTIQALPEVVEAVAGRGVVIVDGGIRRGIDVVKALALGANAVQIGRPVLWGLAVAGEEGVKRVLNLLREELDNAMALCGCPTIADITRDLIAWPIGPGRPGGPTTIPACSPAPN
jgi:4-hydroxymandelate oxidase